MNKLIKYLKHITNNNYGVQLKDIFSELEIIDNIKKIKGNSKYLYIPTNRGYSTILIDDENIVVRHNIGTDTVSETLINKLTKKTLSTNIYKNDNGLKVSTIEKFYDSPNRGELTDIEESSFVITLNTFNKIYPNTCLELLDISKYFSQLKYINEDLYSYGISVDLEYNYEIHDEAFINNVNTYPYVLFNNKDISKNFYYMNGKNKVLRTYNLINGNIDSLVNDRISNITKLSTFNYINKTEVRKLENKILA